MAQYTASDIIDFAIDDNVSDIQTAVDDILNDRVAEFLAAKKIEVAKKYFNGTEE